MLILRSAFSNEGQWKVGSGKKGEAAGSGRDGIAPLPVRHGRGVEKSRYGDFTYDGDFNKDQYHGQGCMRWSDAV